MERQVPRGAFGVTAITAAPKFLHDPVQISRTEPTAPAAVQRIPRLDGPRCGGPGWHHPREPSPFSRGMPHQVTLSITSEDSPWGLPSCCAPAGLSAGRPAGAGTFGGLSCGRSGLVCCSLKARPQQGLDELQGAAGMNRGQALRETLTCLGSLSNRW